MSKGRLGISTLPIGENNAVYTVPSGYSAAINISIVNKNNSSAQVSINLCSSDEVSSGVLPDASYVEYYANIEPYSVLERTGIVLDSQKTVYVVSSSSNLNAVIVGVEEEVL
jgi:hypothetical protein